MRYRVSSVVMPLIMANIAMFLLELVLGDAFTNSLLLVPRDIFTRPWILITSMFLHGGFEHIFFNMYGLLIFGPLLEQRVGPKRFLMIYFITGILAGLGHVFISYLLFGSAPPALGASGALMGVIGTLIVLMPDLRLLFFFIIPMPLWVAGIVWALIDSIGVFFPTGIANIAHLVGMASGLIYGLLLRREKVHYTRRFASKTHLTDQDVEEYLRSGRI